MARSSALGEKMLTVEQAAEFLKLSVRTLQRLVASGYIPYARSGRRLWFSKETLEKFDKKERYEEIVRNTMKSINKDLAKLQRIIDEAAKLGIVLKIVNEPKEGVDS